MEKHEIGNGEHWLYCKKCGRGASDGEELSKNDCTGGNYESTRPIKTMPPLNKENWKQDFEEQFGLDNPVRTFRDHDDFLMVKDYITQLLVSQESQVRKSCAEVVRSKVFTSEDTKIKGLEQRDIREIGRCNRIIESIARSIEQGNK